MDVLGTWRIASVYTFDADFNKELKPVGEVLDAPETDDDMRMMLTAEYEFCADGNLLVKALLPENISREEIDEAVEADEITLCGENRFMIESYEWKEEDGKILFDSGVEGEVLGEKTSPWEEIEQLEDGTLQFFIYRLQKA